MNWKPCEPVNELLAGRIAAGDFPSAVYAIAVRGRVVLADALGEAVRVPARRTATFETVYDLASLTKPLVTGLLCARRIERGEMRLPDAAARWLPEFAARGDKREITVQQLLTHTSGFPAWRPFYLAQGGEKARILDAIVNEPLIAAPGARVEYSDFNFVTLGILLERMTGEYLDDLARVEIVGPLSLGRTRFRPPAEWREFIAASEIGNAHERNEAGHAPHDWREDTIWGEVHDGNAHFLGGVAGHAGLFADARDTVRLAAQFHAGLTELLRPETCALFRTNFTPGHDDARSVAWSLAATKLSTAGPDLPPDAFGHLGFTGTSCWNDPQRERIYVLLTNRTHDKPLPFVNINSTRRAFHSLAHAALNEFEMFDFYE
jgi:CubicO group peptidase (beta-lactamase class C family)